MSLNTQWRLIARPEGEVGREHFDVTHTALPAPVWQPETPGDIALAQQVKHHLDAARSGQLYNA